MATTKVWQRILSLIKRYKEEVSSIYFYAILSGLIQLSLPLGIQAIVGFSLGAAMVTSIYVLIGLVVIGVLFVGILNMNQMKLIEKIEQKIFSGSAIDMSEVIPRLNLLNYDNFYLPEKVNRFFETVSIQKGFSKLLLDLPLASIQILFGLILLAFYHPIFIAFGMILLSLLWLILRLTAKSGLQTSLNESHYKYKVAAWIEEMARVVKSFKFSQGSHLNLKKTDKFMSSYLDERNKHFNILMIQYQVLVAFKVIITAAMLIVGAYLLVNQQINIGEFVAAEIVIITVIAAIEKVITSLSSVYDLATGLEKLESFIESDVESNGKMSLPAVKDGVEIEFNGFSFTYPNGQVILQDADSLFEKNQVHCIQGKDGEGKSTLLKIIATYYKCHFSNITLNKIAMAHYSMLSLRNQIGIYLQDYEIFQGTLFENISMGNDSIKEDFITMLLSKLQFNNLLYSMPSGFDTEIDPAGNKLSNNQVRKILLLRALVRQPRILLLDEPLFNLSHSERTSFINYLNEIKEHTTILIATNDKELIELSNKKWVLSNGSLNEQKN